MKRVAVMALLLLVASPASGQKPDAAALKRRGDAHLAQGAPDKAVAAYRAAIEADPGYREAYSALAAHFLRTREHDQAVTVLRQALARAPDYPQGWYNLAYALRKQGKLDAAIGAYRRFAQLRPRSADPHYGIGLALQAKRDLAGAARSFRRYAALEKTPGKKVWVDKAIALAEKLEQRAGVKPQKAEARPRPVPPPPAKKARPSDETMAPTGSHTDDSRPVTPERERAMKTKAEGDLLSRRGKLAEAAKRYQQATREDYTYTAAYNELGTVLFGLKRYDEAIRTYRIAIRDNPGYHLGWYNLAYALRKAGRVLPAIAAYSKYIEHRPKEPDPFFGLGLAHKAAGNKAEAVKAFKRYAELERRQERERWVHKARVEVAQLEGQEPPPYVPGQVIVAKVEPKKPLTARERRRLARAERRRLRAEKRQRAAEARKAKLEAERLARAERRRLRAEKRQRAAEARKAKLETARLARAERRGLRAEKRRQAAEARKARLEAARLAKTERRRAPSAAPSVAPALAPPVAISGVDLYGVEPAPDVIVSPPLPPAPASPGATPSERYRVRGDTLARVGKLQQAARAYDQAARIDPFNTGAQDGMAYCAFKLGAYRQGARRLSIGIRDNPSYVVGWLHQARLYRAAKDGVKAVGSYRKYLRARPGDLRARLELARTLKALGMGEQAVAEYRTCVTTRKRQGNEAVVVAARSELRGLGVTPPPVASGVVAPRAVTTVVAAPARPVGRGKAEARRLARQEKQQKIERRREARRAKIEAARLARAERARALKEKRRAAAEARRRKLEQRRLLRAERRSARRARRRGRAAGTDIAEAVGQDMAESTPSVEPRRRLHDVLRPAPDAAAGLVKVADEQFAKKRYVVAMGIYQQAARLDPGSSEPLYRAGVAAVALGQMHLAADLFTRVLRLDPGNGTAKVNLEMAEAAAGAARPSADYLTSALSEARTALADGRYALAEQKSSRLLRRTVSADLHLVRGESRLALRKPRQALADGGRALALDPGSTLAMRVMGDAHRQLGHRHKAIYYYRLYLSRSTGDDSAAAERSQIEQVINELRRGDSASD